MIPDDSNNWNGWIISQRARISAIWPKNDLRQHAPLDTQCWCKPSLEDNVLTHNAMDRREEYERGRKLS